MSGERFKVCAFAVAAALWAGASSMLAPTINRQRTALKLTVDPEERKSLPPELALTQAALGSFRGLAVDYLSIRLNRLKEQGKYYEAMDLSRWIALLQPRYAKVWEYHAWNLAYNISDAVKRPEEKWEWIQAGVKLLRNEAIPRNPTAHKLYENLAYIYHHRIGRFSAIGHEYFKQQHAREWHNLLGAPPRASREAALQWFKPVADAPATLDELLAQVPSTKAALDALKALLEEGQLDARFLARVAFAKALGDEASELPDGVRLDAQDAALRTWLTDAANASAREALLAFVRAKVLREDERMDPRFMLEIMETFGPIDWRHPSAQAVYWSLLGARQGETTGEYDFFTMVQTDRIVLHGLKTLALAGSLSFDPLTNYHSPVPEPLLFDAYEKALTEAARRQNKAGTTPYELEESHRGTLEQLAHLAYLYGYSEKAEELYAKLRSQYGHRSDYTRPLLTFVRDQLGAGAATHEFAKPALQGLISRAIHEGFSAGRMQLAGHFIGLARILHEDYQRKQREQGPGTNKLELPPLERMVADGFSRFVCATHIAHVFRARVWRRAPEEWKRMVFDDVRTQLYEQATRAGLDPQRAYPEPPGMDLYRQKQVPVKHE